MKHLDPALQHLNVPFGWTALRRGWMEEGDRIPSIPNGIRKMMLLADLLRPVLIGLGLRRGPEVDANHWGRRPVMITRAAEAAPAGLPSSRCFSRVGAGLPCEHARKLRGNFW